MISSFKEDSSNDEKNHESSKIKVLSRQIDFTLEKYQTWLDL